MVGGVQFGAGIIRGDAVSGKSLRDAAVHKSGMIPILYNETDGNLSG
jgi:hypothetical protein